MNRRIRLGIAFLVGALAATLVVAPVVSAACGPRIQRAAAKRAIAGAQAPLVIGDSVVAGAVPQIARFGFEVDAQCGRQIWHGLPMVRARLRAKTMPRMLIWALGTNGPQTLSNIRELKRLLGHQRVLILVTPRGPFSWAGSTARSYRAAARRWPNTVFVADWAWAPAQRNGWLWPDGIHLNPRGASAFGRLLRDQLPHHPAHPRNPRNDPETTAASR